MARRSPRLDLTLRFDEEIFRFADDSGNQLLTMTEAIGAAGRATLAAERAETERNLAVREAERARARADELAAKLRALGIDPQD